MDNNITSNTISIKRKCACCGENFYINKMNINDAIYYDKKNYHSSCFIEMCEKRATAKRIDVSQKWTQILNSYNSIKQESDIFLKNSIAKEEIFQFIQEVYDVKVVPTSVWHKLGDIYSGSYKGMASGIPPEHLLYMWKRKIDMLNNTANRNTSNGKTMTTEQRIKYDLTILINKYDGYLRWLEKQKILEAEKQVEKTNTVLSEKICHMTNKKENKNIDNKNDIDDDISDLVDEIFG